jgi:Uma2 family endonuclease
MNQTISDQVRWTTSDLELLTTDEWKRYEIVDGELFVTRASHWKHQRTAGNIHLELEIWSRSSKLGEPITTPGIIFTDADNVIPDVVWIGNERLGQLLDDEGHLRGAPELIVEVLSPGTTNERRDREAKLKLYSSTGVREYWIANWQLQQLEVYRREAAQLKLIATLLGDDEITSTILPGFCVRVQRFFI